MQKKAMPIWYYLPLTGSQDWWSQQFVSRRFHEFTVYTYLGIPILTKNMLFYGFFQLKWSCRQRLICQFDTIYSLSQVAKGQDWWILSSFRVLPWKVPESHPPCFEDTISFCIYIMRSHQLELSVTANLKPSMDFSHRIQKNRMIIGQLRVHR